MALRAKWTTKYEKELVDILNEYRSSHLRGQNGWSTEGWNRIVKDFNKLFLEAQFSKTKIQDKEAQLKKDYRAIKSIRSRSSVSWNDDASIINTTDEIWDEIAEEDPKLRRYENKSFPLFESLDLLYEGQLAEGKHCFTSSKPNATASKGLEAPKEKRTLVDFKKENPWDVPINVGARSCGSDDEDHSPLRFDEPRTLDLDSESVQTQGLEKQSSHHVNKKRSSQQRLVNSGRQGLRTEVQQTQTVNLSDDDGDEQEKSDDNTSSRSGIAGPSRGRSKRRNGAKVPRIEETMSDFMSLKREQFAAKEQQKCQGQEFSMTRCLAVLNDIDGLNRQIFLGYSLCPTNKCSSLTFMFLFDPLSYLKYFNKYYLFCYDLYYY